MRWLNHVLCRNINLLAAFLIVCTMYMSAGHAQSLDVKNGRAHFQHALTDADAKKEKSPKGAMIRTLVIPGWGQLYNEQYIKAGLVFSVRTFLIGLAVYYQSEVNEATTDADRDFYITKRNDAIVFYGIATIISMIDAYIDAHLYDFDVGPDLEIQLGMVTTSSRRPHMPGIGFTLRKRF